MKKLYTLALAMICGAFSVNATHLMGGQMTVRQLNTFEHEVTLTVYRDSVGIPIAPSMSISVQMVGSTSPMSYSAPHSGAVNFLNGVEEYTYTDTIVLQLPGDYMISWTNCCRNGAILNMANPLSESFFLNTIISYSPTATESSPVFLNPPVTLAQRNMLYQYNPLPFDADGDSLAWSMTVPLSSNITDTVAGYVLPSADPGNTFTLDPVTGEITWVPNLVGNFVASFLVEEFRGGLKIGEIRRDMQIIVLPDSTNPNRAWLDTAPLNSVVSGQYFINAPVAQTTSLTLVAFDPDYDFLKLQFAGEPFAVANNKATFTSINGQGIANATMIWTPTTAHYRTAPYIVALRTTELHGPYAFTHDITFNINVGGVLSTNDIASENSLGQVYPNPTQGSLAIPFHLEKSGNVQITIMNLNGQIVAELLDQEMPAGNNHLIAKLPNIAKGVYMLNFRTENGTAKMQRIIISE